MGQMLRQAVYMEDMVTLEHLVKQRADLESRDETGTTPLHIAATQSKADTVLWLLGRRADVAARDGEGFSAMTWACIKGHHSVLKLLLNGKADLEELHLSTDGNAGTGKTVLALSAERGHLDVVQELLLRRARVDQSCKDGSTALMCAAQHVETEIVAFLLGKNSIVNDTDSEGWTALMYSVNASVQGSEQAEKKVNIDGCVGKKTTTELLLLHKADVNAQTEKDGLSPLIIASGRARPMAVKKLLDSRAQVNLTSTKGQSAIIMASALDQPEVVKALIVATADVNQQNEKKDSSLSLAEKYGNKEVVELLIRAGATAPKAKKKAKAGKKK